MSITTYQGTVENGQVKLSRDVNLPENAKVYVVVPDGGSATTCGKIDLAELVARMPSDYQVREEEFGTRAGREVW